MDNSIIKDIKSPISEEMNQFEGWFRSSMKSSVPLLDKISHYIIKRKGKQMRPMFVFLSAKLFSKEKITESTYVAASLIELLHTATLVHDDVVDEAYLRRGFFSINALWKNKIAVLVGDYLLSQGLLLSIENNQFELLRIVSRAVKQMSEGELLQIEKARKLDIEEPIYFEIIKQKTASLIAACCAGGAASVGCNTDDIEKMRLFGELTGIAFQIKDDLFDYGNGDKIGKPSGIDIREKKMTLPLIYTLNNASSADKKLLINTVKNHNTDKKKVQEAIDFVIKSGGIEYAKEKMLVYRKQAIDLLHTFEQNEAAKAIEKLVIYSTERVK